jgi:hypothetical protein
MQYIAENESGKNESARSGAYPYDIIIMCRYNCGKYNINILLYLNLIIKTGALSKRYAKKKINNL